MKTQRIMALFISVLLVTGSLACVVCGWPGVYGSGRVVEEEREVSGFTGIELATFGNLYIKVGDEEKLRIEAEDNLIPYFEVRVYEGVLKIASRPGASPSATRPVNFYLTVKELDTIVLSGSGDIKAPDLEAERFSVTISGSGDIEMGNLNAGEVEIRTFGSGNLDVAGSEAAEQDVTINGSGDVKIGNLDAGALEAQISGSGSLDILGGQIEEQKVTISGSGDYGARHLASAEADARISGSGSMTIQVSNRLEISISGSGDARYAGSPTLEQAVTGSGDVIQIERGAD